MSALTPSKLSRRSSKSFSLGYDHSIVAGVGYTSSFFAGLKYHFGEGRALADYDRTGPIQYSGNATPGSNLKF